MKIDLAPFASRFPAHEWPTAPCPACGRGTVVPEPDSDPARAKRGHDSTERVETEQSLRLHDDDGWDPTWMAGRFHGTLRCTNPRCRERCVVAGDFDVREIFDDNYGWVPETFYQLRYVDPPFPLLEPPVETPELVAAYAIESATLVWHSPEAAANSLRKSVEALLDVHSVPRSGLNSDGDEVRYSTHQRIGKLPRQLRSVKEVKAALMAVKWAGNDGSHVPATPGSAVGQAASGAVSVAACLEAAEHLGYALELLYDPTSERIRRRVHQINQARTTRVNPV